MDINDLVKDASQAPEKVLQGAVKLFMRAGIKSVNMDDLARELAISKKTLYKHVKDKRDLVHQCLRYQIQANREMLQAVAQEEGNAIDRHFVMLRHIRNMLQELHPSVLFDLEKYYPEAHKMMSQAREQMIFETMSRNLDRGQAEGLYRKDCDPSLVTRFLVAITSAVFRSDTLNATGRSILDLQVEAFAYHIRGIASEKGLEYIEWKLQNESPTVS
jgi:AcrR family transcriptional regulator